MIIPYTRPPIGAREVVAALRPGSGRREFEAAVAKMVGARYALAFSFAHSAFYALLKVLDLTDAEIILPAYTCDIMAEVVVATGNRPVFVDIDLADFNMNLDALRSALTPQTRAIVATHMFGYPTDIRAIRRIVGGENILVVEDSALSLTCSTRLTGDVGLYSFGPGKPLYTVRGGVCVMNDAAQYDKTREYRDRHMSRVSAKEWARRWGRLGVSCATQTDVGMGIAQKAKLVRSGLSRSETEIPESYATAYADFQARMGLALLDKADLLLAERRAIASEYDRRLQGIPGLVPAPMKSGATWSHYSVRISNRDQIRFRERLAEHRVQAGRTFDYCLPGLPRYGRFADRSYPQAEEAGKQVVNLPLYAGLRKDQLDLIANQVATVLHESK